MSEITEYACRFTDWTNDGEEKQIVKYETTGTGNRGLQGARGIAKGTRLWQSRQGLPMDAVVVSRTVPAWTVVGEAS